MTVAVQNGLENLMGALRLYGFDVVEYGKYPYPIDAYVYVGTNVMQSVRVVSDACDGHGVFMVNAHEKSAREISEILSRRTYTPLF